MRPGSRSAPPGGVRRLLAPPVFAGDERRTLLAGLLHPILLSVLFGVVLYGLVAPVHGERQALVYGFCGVMGLVAVGLLFAVRRGQVSAAARVLVAAVWLVLVSGAAISGGVRAASFSGLVIAVLCAGVLLGPGAALLAAVASILAGALMLGHVAPPPGDPDDIRKQAFLAQAVYMLVAAVLLSAVMRSMRAALVGARREAQERRAALAQLSEAQAGREQLIRQLEAKNAELESFTYTVSHDLRSPLVTVKGFVAHLSRDLRAGDPVRALADLARIQGAAERMERLLKDLLELSRIGRIVHPPAELPFEEVVREALFLLQGRVAERGVRVEVASELPRVWADRTRLVQVVQNLVDNAIKFSAGRADPLVEIGCRPPDASGTPVLFVRDNGAGIPAEQRDSVFALFWKLDPQAEGTGIGLALARRIVEVHGGRIWAESEGRGRGATFCFTLPARPGDSFGGGLSARA